MHNDSFNNPLNSCNVSVPNVGGGCSINVPGTGDCNVSSFSAESAEHMGSGKYVSVRNVAARIARNVKGREIDIYDIAEWCGECETDEIGMYEGFVKYRNVRVPVKHNRCYMPCNIYRILSVHRNKCCISRYQWDGAYLRFNFDDPKTFNDEYYVEIDYLGVAVDEDGLPMILDGNQEACFWYIMTKVYFEDYMNGLFPENRYQYLNDRLGHYVDKSKGSFRHITRDDMNELQMIMHNLIPKVKMSRNVD